MKRSNDKNEVLKFINNDGKCFYQYGFGFKGAGKRPITKDKALDLFPKYSFGMGFYELDWITVDGEDAILFNEFSENDLY